MPDMLEQKGQFAWILKTARIAMIASIALLALAVIGSMALTVAGAIEAATTGNWTPVTPYALGLIATLIVAAWLPVAYGLTQTIISNEMSVSRTLGRLERVETLMEDQDRTLRKLVDLESLSDQAKSLIYRDKEIEAFREVIHDAMIRQDYETADAMIEIMEHKFGYADEAARLREELTTERRATLDEKIDWAIGRIQKIMELHHDWPRALRAAQKLQTTFPGNPKVDSLPQYVETERTNHKRKLLQEYGEAVRKNDIDGGITLLQELDRHLSPQEAAALQESARGVFRAKLHNLGVQFAIHVTDERWEEAVTIGEQIIRNFPNSRMGEEVREKMPQLRAHAAAVAAVGSRNE